MTNPRGCARGSELEAALDGRLDREATEAALRHTAGCASCRASRQTHTTLRSLARGLPGYVPDPLAARRVRAAVMRASLVGPPPRSTVGLVLAVAATVLLVLAGALTLRFHGRARPQGGLRDTGDVALAGAGTMTAAPGAVVTVQRAGHDTRIELVSGEVGFVVEHRRPGERFVVATTDAEVEVRGTRFRVTARDGHLRRVQVMAGRVAVRHVGDPEQLVPAGATLDVPDSPAMPPAPPVSAPSVPTPQASNESLTPLAVDPPRAHPPAHHSVDRSGDRSVDHSVDTVARDFRDGALAYVRGENLPAALALRRFLDAAPALDARREDARYVLVLSLMRAGAGVEAETAALAYLREFPRGLRRPEVATELAVAAARRGDCDRASGAALSLPEDTEPRLRAEVVQALATCHGR